MTTTLQGGGFSPPLTSLATPGGLFPPVLSLFVLFQISGIIGGTARAYTLDETGEDDGDGEGLDQYDYIQSLMDRIRQGGVAGCAYPMEGPVLQCQSFAASQQSADAISSALTASVQDLGFSLNSDSLKTSGDLSTGLQLFTHFYKFLNTICYMNQLNLHIIDSHILNTATCEHAV